MASDGKGKGRDDTAGRRPGRNTTFAVEAYQDDGLGPIQPQDLMDPDATGAALVGEDVDGYHAQTAMFDKGKFLGELADIVDGAPDTRAHVEAEAKAPLGCRLIVVAGPDVGMEWAFKVPEIVMGRDEDCQLVMQDIGVSRRHAKITLEGSRFILQDLSSNNGTHLNGVLITREELVPGDEIVIGERTIRFVELNDAPATAAAHPVPKSLPREPEVGSVPTSDLDEGFKPLGKASQIDVGVVPKADGPAASQSKVKSKAAPKSITPRPGAALKSVATMLGLLIFLGAVGGGGWYAYDRYFRSESPAERLARSKREFLQGVELVKDKRFGDASIMFQRVLIERPEYGRAQEYLEHSKREVMVWKDLEAGRAAAKAGRYNEAIDALRSIPSESAYRADADAMIAEYLLIIAKGLVEDARAKLKANDLDAAADLIGRALERAPKLKAAKELESEIEALKKERDKPVLKQKAKFEIPSQLLRAVALYKNGQVAAAIDATEAAGGPDSKDWVARMERIKDLLDEAEGAHKKKAAGELLRIAPAALEIDALISGGEGKVRDRIEKLYADGLFLKGVEAADAGEEVKAYKLFSDAVAANPGHKLARSRLAEIGGRAEKIYYEGYVLKDTNPAEARKMFRKLIQTTAPDDPYRKLAEKWLNNP